MEKNLTSGSVLKTMMLFALPYFLSYFLQTLYGMADLYIIGLFDGVNSTTAVTNGSQVMYMLTVIIVGLAMGSTVMIGRSAGAGIGKDVEKAIGTTASMFLTISICLTLILVWCTGPIVRLIGTPAEAVAGTEEYLRICFVGIPFITAYNIISAIFRGLGDSRRPMYFIAVACGANIGLDFLFIGAFDMGPAGAALGTTLSQTLSVIIALVYIRKNRSSTSIHLEKSDFRPDMPMLRKILKVGIPVAVQDGCIQVAFMIITVIANYRGLTDAAAVGIVEKLITMIFIVPSSMLATVSALSAQCMGAGKYGRAAKVLRYATIITSCYGIGMTILIQFIKLPLLSMFTTDQAVVVMGAQYLTTYIFDCIFAGIHFSFSGYFAAYGKSYIGFLHNILAITIIRVPGSYLASVYFPDTLFQMGLAAPAGSLLSVIICLIFFTVLKRKGSIRTVDEA